MGVGFGRRPLAERLNDPDGKPGFDPQPGFFLGKVQFSTEKRLAIAAIAAQANLRGKGVRRTEPCCVKFGT